MDELRELRGFRDEVPALTDDEHDALARRILERTTAAARHPVRRWLHRLPRRVWIPAVAAVLTAALAIGIGVLTDRWGDEPEPARSKKSTILEEAADRLETVVSGPVVIPRDDQWRYRRTMYLSSEIGQQEDEEWVSADFDQAAYYRGGVLRISDGDMNDLTSFSDFASVGELYEFFAGLPDNPSAVLDRIYGLVDERAGAHGPDLICLEEAACETARKESWHRDGAAYSVIHHLLANGVPPAEVQAKLFRAMREIPGVQDEGRIVDITGKEVQLVGWRPPFTERPGIAIEGLIRVAIDPGTSMFRGTLGFLIYPEPSDTAVEAEIILDSGFVDEPARFPTVLSDEAAHLDEYASDPVEIPEPDQWRYRKIAYGAGVELAAKEERWLRADYGRVAEYDDNQELRTRTADADSEVFADLVELSTFLRDLPDDPAAVADRVAALVDEHNLAATFECSDRPGCEPAWPEVWSRHGATVDLIRVLLEQGVPPPAVQAKLFRALDEIPGVHNAGRDTDLTGREVLVVSWKPAYIKDLDARRTRTVNLLIDAETHRYLGNRELRTDTGLPREFLVLDAGIVDRLGGQP